MQKKIEFFERVLDYKPLPKQLEFHNLTNKFKAYIGGLGSGKSFAGIFETIYTVLSYPKVLNVTLAPTNKLLKDSVIKTFREYCPKEFVRKYNRSDQRMEFINKSEILFRSCEDMKSIDRLRNINIGDFWIDEARGVPYYAWEVLVGRLRQLHAPLTGRITTTPIGYRWQWKKFVRDNNPQYAWVNSSSRENIYLPKDYIATLESEYAGSFAKQEIDGQFVNFEGLVYESFNRNIHILTSAEQIVLKDVVIGLDFGFTNQTAIAVLGIDTDKRVYLIDEFYEKRIMMTQLIEVLRDFKKKYNFSRIYADPSEPQFIEQLGSEFITEKAINDIMPGISEVSSRMQVQKDGRPRFYILNKCTNAIMELENYRYPDKKEEKPEQEKPLKVQDHLCFIKGTKILTSKGNKNIEDVKIGDFVLTRKGWKPVIVSAETNKNEEIYEISISDGRKLRCTGNHPFWVKNKGWIKADALRYAYILVDANSYVWKASNLMGKVIINQMMDIGDIQIKNSINQSICTELFGNLIMEQYRQNTTYITKTEIKTIIKYQILKWLLQKNILKDIQKNVILNILKELDCLQKNGMQAKKEINGIVNIGKNLLQKHLLKENLSVNNVEKNILPEHRTKIQNSAIQTARQNPCVLGVRKLKKKQAVYNIYVSDCHEYFANGILVSNCDAIRYGVMGIKSYASGDLSYI